MQYSGEQPYSQSHAQLSYGLSAPVTAGLIKTAPEDFFVAEELLAIDGASVHEAGEPQSALPTQPLKAPANLLAGGEHTWLHIRKRNANTDWVAGQLAQFAGIRKPDVGYAGRKDRHAVTEQWFSCYLPGRNDIDWSTLDITGVELLQAGRRRCKLRRGDLIRNHFNIIVRAESRGWSSAETAQLDARLNRLQQSGFPNYFGPQRFGIDGGNLRAAHELLVDGKRIKRNRDLYLSAARSWLFNLYLSRQIQSGDRQPPASGSLDGPLYGKSRDPQPGEEHLGQVERLWVEGLRRQGVKAGTRALTTVPEGLSWSWLSPDSSHHQGALALNLKFSLPVGSFATGLLRELVICKDCSTRRGA